MRVLPRPPHTNAFRVFVDIPDEQLEEATLLMMGKDQICPAFWWVQGDVPGWPMTEVNVGDATWGGDVEEQLVDLGALFDSARTAVRVDIRSEATLRGTGGSPPTLPTRATGSPPLGETIAGPTQCQILGALEAREQCG